MEHSITRHYNICAICHESLSSDEKVANVSKGIATMIKSSQMRLDNKWQQWTHATTLRVHENCRKTYCCERMAIAAQKRTYQYLNKEEQTAESEAFDFTSRCIFCAKQCSQKSESKKPKNKRVKIFNISGDIEFFNSIIEIAKCRHDDRSIKIRNHFTDAVDLNTLEAKDHHQCSILFFRRKTEITERPVPYKSFFEKLYKFLENSPNSQFALEDVVTAAVSDEIDPPHFKYIIRKLNEKYADNIIISYGRNKKTILTFRGKNEEKILLEHFYNNFVKTEEDKKNEIIEMAARYIQNDIRNTFHATDFNQQRDLIKNEALKNAPQSLKLFLNTLFVKAATKRKASFDKDSTKLKTDNNDDSMQTEGSLIDDDNDMPLEPTDNNDIIPLDIETDEKVLNIARDMIISTKRKISKKRTRDIVTNNSKQAGCSSW